MSENTKIEWCDATVNWWAGCTKVSPACDKCYAERMAGRLWKTQWGAGQPRTKFIGAAAALQALDRKAERLGRPLKVFHNSLSDFLDKEVPMEWRLEAMRGMATTPHLIHLILTKRIGNFASLFGDYKTVPLLPNVWLGATIVNQEEADRDIPKLLAVPAAKRFLSMEPLLGPVDLENIQLRRGTGDVEAFSALRFDGDAEDKPELGTATLDWVIVGGESGPGARPMHPDWARSLRDQCEAAGVPFLFKQWGEWGEADAVETYGQAPHGWWENDPEDGGYPRQSFPGPMRGGIELSSLRPEVFRVGKKAAGRLLDGRTHDGFPS